MLCLQTLTCHVVSPPRPSHPPLSRSGVATRTAGQPVVPTSCPAVLVSPDPHTLLCPGQVLLQGLPDNQWSPLVHRDTVSDTLTKRGRNTPTLKKYETVFCPCNKVEEALLSLLIGQVGSLFITYRTGWFSFQNLIRNSSP